MDLTFTANSPSHYQQMLELSAECRTGLERLVDAGFKKYVRLGNPVTAIESDPLAIVMKGGRVYGEYLHGRIFPRIVLKPINISQIPFEQYPSVAALNRVLATVNAALYNSKTH